MSANLQDWQWWSVPEGEEHQHRVGELIKVLREQIETYDVSRRKDLVALRAMYLDLPSDRYEHLAYYRTMRSRFNLIQGAVDSTHAELVTSRPRPKIDTVGADHEARRKAKRRQMWIDGFYTQIRAYEKLDGMGMDGLLYGTGCLKVATEDDKIAIDRVWVGDLWVDPREERHNRVRTLYHVSSIDKSVLQAEFPDHADEIGRAKETSDERIDFPDLEIGDLFSSPTMVEVVEAWRLPSRSKPKAVVTNDGTVMLGAGRHVIVVGSTVVHDEEWTIDRFPFVFFNWAVDTQRFFGQGMVERGVGMQADMNRLTEIIQQTYETFVPQLWVADGQGVDVGSLNDVVGVVNRCNPASGDIRTAVQLLSPDVSAGLLNREAEIAGRFLPTLGVDVMGAQAEKPAGLNSGEALRNFKDFTSQRHISPGRRFEQGSVDMAELIFYFADRLQAQGHTQALEMLGGKRGLELVKYSEVQAEGDERFVTSIKPGSALPKDVSGKIQTILDLQMAGLPIDPIRLAEMMDMPDTDALMEELTAEREVVLKAIDECSDLDEPQPNANAFWSREYALQELTRSIQLAEIRGADEEVMRRLRLLHGQVRSFPDPNAPPPMPPEGLGAPPPGAAMPGAEMPGPEMAANLPPEMPPGVMQ